MLGTENLGVFITAGLLLNATPGPDTMYILGRTIAQGRSAGIASVLGISSGCLVHSLGAAFGLSAILLSSRWVFSCVKFAGAGYLIYLGVQMFIERPKSADAPTQHFPVENFWNIYRQAVITNVLNPKVALFFMAFLPQFVASNNEDKVLPFLFLGAIFIFNGTLYCLGLVFFTAILFSRFRRSAGSATFTKCLTGVVFIGIGAKLALASTSFH